jgi:hypothetical protein
MSTSRTPSKNFPRATGAGIVNLKPSTPSLRMANGGQMDMYARASQTTNGTIALQNQMAGTSPSAAPADTRLTNENQRMGMAAGLLHSNQTPMVAPQITNTPVSLQMADGGVFDSLRRAVGMGAPETMREKFARQDAERAASRPQVPSVTPSLAATPMPAPMGSQSVIDGRMKAAGLQNGGQVPGTGKGDKIPAKYEPGEFVVSNDMLDAAPSLRGELHSLRNAVLAKKGMTPEQADAKAVVGGGLRAVNAFDPASYLKTTFPGGGADLELSRHNAASSNTAGAGNAQSQTTSGTPNVGSSVAGATPGTAGSSASSGQSAGAAGVKPDFSANPAKPFEFDPTAKYPDGPSLRQRAADLFKSKPKPLTPAPYSAGAAIGAAKPFMGPAAIAASLYDEQRNVERVAQDPNASKLDVATQQAEGLGRWGAAGAAGLAAATAAAPTAPFTMGAGPLVAGALGSVAGYYGADGAIKAGRLLAGSDAAAPVDQLRGQQAPTAATPYTPRPDSVQPWGREGRSSLSGVSPGQTAAPVRGAEDFTAPLRDVPVNLPKGLRDGMVYKTRDAKGNITYSGRNVSGDVSDKMLNGDGTSAGGMRGSVQVAAGAPTFGPNGSYVIDNQAPTGEAKQRAINQSLMGPGGTKMSPNDVAIMAANQRDGVDLYRGTSQDMSLRGGAGGGRDSAEIARLKELIASPIGTPGRKSAAALLQQHMQNQGSMDVAKLQQETTLRGKQMEIDTAQARRNAIGQAAQAAGGDPVKTAQILSNLGLTDDAAHFTTMAGQAQTREKGAQELGTTARENTKKEFRVYDAKDPSKVDEAASQQAFDAVRQIFPGIESADEGTRNKFMSDAKEMHGIFQKARSQDRVGWDALKFWEPKRPALSAMPSLRNGKTEQVGVFDGLVTVNASNGDTLVKRQDGTTLNLGQLTSRQRELVENAKTSGWGK